MYHMILGEKVSLTCHSCMLMCVRVVCVCACVGRGGSPHHSYVNLNEAVALVSHLRFHLYHF